MNASFESIQLWRMIHNKCTSLLCVHLLNNVGLPSFSVASLTRNPACCDEPGAHCGAFWHWLIGHATTLERKLNNRCNQVRISMVGKFFSMTHIVIIFITLPANTPTNNSISKNKKNIGADKFSPLLDTQALISWAIRMTFELLSWGYAATCRRSQCTAKLSRMHSHQLL